jgi:hypothetical protein
MNPLINGLADHDGQMIVVDSIMPPGQVCNFQYIRIYSNYNINKFQEMLSYELWDVFTNDNVNNIFNTFLNTYLKIFYSCFTKRKIIPRLMYNPWITTGLILMYTFCIYYVLFLCLLTIALLHHVFYIVVKVATSTEV